MTADPADLTATAARRAIGAGRLDPRDLLEACLALAASREPALHAMAAWAPDTLRQAVPHDGVLRGLPVGVKDVIDTAEYTTEYNSPIWHGHRPRADAACVAWARAAGAVVFGKTVTTEFATRAPGPTTNPHDPARTPGGSSSGSAAGVAAGYFPFAYGTQTGGSVIRPAAFCGVVGYKPSFGTINRFGMKLMSENLDTVGVLARSVADCALLTAAVTGLDLGDPEQMADHAPRIGLCRSPMWDRRSPETESLFDAVAAAVTRAGAAVRDLELPDAFAPLEAAHAIVMNAESARALGWELSTARDQISPGLRERLEWGLSHSGQKLLEARATFRALQNAFDDVVAEVDFLLAPAAPGVAPIGLDWTGDPSFNLLWTSLHVPCVTVPAGEGPGGMPLGIQIVAARGRDRDALRWAAWVASAVG